MPGRRLALLRQQHLTSQSQTRELLHELSSHPQQQPTHSTRPSLIPLLPSNQITNTHSVIPLVVRRELDLTQLRLDVRVLNLSPFQIGQNLLCFVESSLHNQPTRTLRKPRNSCVQDDDEDELQSERDPPRDSSGHVREAKRDPIGQRKSGDVHDELDDDELASPRCLRGLALPRGSRSSVQTVAYPSYNPSNDHVRDAIRRALQQGANAHDCRADEDCFLPAQVVSEDERSYCAEETSNVVDRCNSALHADVIAYAECVEEVASDDNATEYTLVVAELPLSSAKVHTLLQLRERTSSYESHISRTRDRHPKSQPSSPEAEIPFAFHRVVIAACSSSSSVDQAIKQE